MPAERWLTQRDIVAIGCDNMAVEVMTLIENLALDELARDGVVTFGFILVATKFKGATGCPVRPIALVRGGTQGH